MSLFPSTEGDLTTDCTCPDWARPCKHVAAVYYLLGERFDADPFLLFQVRGRSREQVLDALRARRATAASPAAEPAAAPAQPDEPPEEEPLAAFWSAPRPALDLVLSFAPPDMDALVLKRLGPPDFAQDRPAFQHAAERLYRAISQKATRLALGEE